MKQIARMTHSGDEHPQLAVRIFWCQRCGSLRIDNESGDITREELESPMIVERVRQAFREGIATNPRMAAALKESCGLPLDY